MQNSYAAKLLSDKDRLEVTKFWYSLSPEDQQKLDFIFEDMDRHIRAMVNKGEFVSFPEMLFRLIMSQQREISAMKSQLQLLQSK